MKHTQLPWRVEETRNPESIMIQAADDWVESYPLIVNIAHVLGGEAGTIKANAEFIVKACNTHAELLEALIDIARGPLQESDFAHHAVLIARAAIARAARTAD